MGGHNQKIWEKMIYKLANNKVIAFFVVLFFNVGFVYSTDELLINESKLLLFGCKSSAIIKTKDNKGNNTFVYTLEVTDCIGKDTIIKTAPVSIDRVVEDFWEIKHNNDFSIIHLQKVPLLPLILAYLVEGWLFALLIYTVVLLFKKKSSA